MTGPYIFADILDFKNLQEIIVNEGVDWMIHFSALLSAIGEHVSSLLLYLTFMGCLSPVRCAPGLCIA